MGSSYRSKPDVTANGYFRHPMTEVEECGYCGHRAAAYWDGIDTRFGMAVTIGPYCTPTCAHNAQSYVALKRA